MPSDSSDCRCYGIVALLLTASPTHAHWMITKYERGGEKKQVQSVYGANAYESRGSATRSDSSGGETICAAVIYSPGLYGAL